MDPNKFQKYVIERLQVIESKVFGGTREEHYGSARELAEAISKGETENRFNGERTLESAKQRIKAFYQNYDEGAIRSLYGDEKTQYEKELSIVTMLSQKYKLQEFAWSLRK